jgi:hypothetical protein
MKLLVTGGAGFIGSAFVRMMLGAKNATRLINYDKLTYAGNLENLVSIAGDPRYMITEAGIVAADFSVTNSAEIRSASPLPQWDRKRRQLSFDGCVVKRFRLPAGMGRHSACRSLRFIVQFA